MTLFIILQDPTPSLDQDQERLAKLFERKGGRWGQCVELVSQVRIKRVILGQTEL